MGNDRKRTGLGALAQAGDDDFSVITAIGGPRGVVESMLPGFLFVVMFVVTSNLQLTIIVSAALAVLQVVVRLCQRQSVMGALSGLAAVAICLIWAWRTGEARDYYMYGFLTNAAYIVLLLVSLAVHVPALGFLIEFIRIYGIVVDRLIYGKVHLRQGDPLFSDIVALQKGAVYDPAGSDGSQHEEKEDERKLDLYGIPLPSGIIYSLIRHFYPPCRSALR